MKFDFLYKTIRKLEKIEVECDYGDLDNGQYIFAPTHISKYDVQLLLELIPQKVILLSANEEELKRTLSGLFLKIIGVIYVDRYSRESRNKAKEKIIQNLNLGKSILMFLEGTRNKTQEILLPFKKGAVEIAAISGSPIIPIGITNTVRNNKNHIRCSIGDKIYVNREEDVEIANHRVRTAVLGLIN
jgi:1-acyl-sn-glycerol-3-phosphate acyltransferase